VIALDLKGLAISAIGVHSGAMDPSHVLRRWVCICTGGCKPALQPGYERNHADVDFALELVRQRRSSGELSPLQGDATSEPASSRLRSSAEQSRLVMDTGYQFYHDSTCHGGTDIAVAMWAR